MAAHSSVLAWGIPGMGSHRVGHDWSDLAAAAGQCPRITLPQPLAETLTVPLPHVVSIKPHPSLAQGFGAVIGSLTQSAPRRAFLGEAESLPWAPQGRSGEDRLPAWGRQEPESRPWAGTIPWGSKRQPAPVFSPGESHGQRSLVGYGPQGPRESNTTKHA